MAPESSGIGAHPRFVKAKIGPRTSMTSRPSWIVLAEDNAPDVFLIREALKRESLSCRVDVIDDGDQVLKFIDGLEVDSQAGTPDLFLIDLNLPTRSGEEILARLRASVRSAGVPVIVISSSDAPRDRDLAKEHRVQLYFRKPSELEAFMGIGGHIRAILEKRSPLR
jgi:chemotaxis family two-component system response regulator Rcp1